MGEHTCDEEKGCQACEKTEQCGQSEKEMHERMLCTIRKSSEQFLKTLL